MYIFPANANIATHNSWRTALLFSFDFRKHTWLFICHNVYKRCGVTCQSSAKPTWHFGRKVICIVRLSKLLLSCGCVSSTFTRCMWSRPHSAIHLQFVNENPAIAGMADRGLAIADIFLNPAPHLQGGLPFCGRIQVPVYTVAVLCGNSHTNSIRLDVQPHNTPFMITHNHAQRNTWRKILECKFWNLCILVYLLVLCNLLLLTRCCRTLTATVIIAFGRHLT